MRRVSDEGGPENSQSLREGLSYDYRDNEVQDCSVSVHLQLDPVEDTGKRMQSRKLFETEAMYGPVMSLALMNRMST